MRSGGQDFTNFCASAIGTFVSMFVLGIGDRHQGNMMIASDMNFFNIDFGFSFGETPFLDTSEFPIPFFLKDYLKASKVDETGNRTYYDVFKSECWRALVVLSEYRDILNHIAEKHIKDPKKLGDVKRTLERTLSFEVLNQPAFFHKIDRGPIWALPKNVAHNIV